MPEKITLRGHEIMCVDFGELAELAGKSTQALRKMENRGFLPKPILRRASIIIKQGEKAGEKMPGERLYTSSLANAILPILLSIKRGTSTTNEQKVAIHAAFQKEKEYIQNLK